MSESEELQVLASFGTSLETALVFAVRQSDWAVSDTRDYPTFVLRINDHEAHVVEILNQPIAEVWQSTNGTAYCPTSNGEILIYFDGTWSKENICNRDEEFGAIWGFSDSSGTDDTLYIVSDTNLFIRSNRIWQEYPMPEQVEMTYRLHGLILDEIYICSDAGLFLWNGTKLTEMEGPDDEPSAVLVLSKTEMLVVGESGLYHWIDSAGWGEIESPLEEFASGIINWNGDVLIPALDGIARLHDGIITKEAEFSCNSLTNVGNAVLAGGADGGLFVSHDGKKWSEISLPNVDSD